MFSLTTGFVCTTGSSDVCSDCVYGSSDMGGDCVTGSWDMGSDWATGSSEVIVGVIAIDSVRISSIGCYMRMCVSSCNAGDGDSIIFNNNGQILGNNEQILGNNGQILGNNKYLHPYSNRFELHIYIE